MKYIIVVLTVALFGCSEGTEQAQGLTTPATDPALLEADSVHGSRVDGTNVTTPRLDTTVPVQ